MESYTATDTRIYITNDFSQDQPAPSFTALDAKILELTYPPYKYPMASVCVHILQVKVY
jgi:hypothetical protein